MPATTTTEPASLPWTQRVTSTWAAWWPWRPGTVAWVALTAVFLIDVVDLVFGLDGTPTGRFTQPPSTFVGFVALAALGRSRLGLTGRVLWAWRETLLAGTVIVAILCVYFERTAGSAWETAGLVVASSMEELSYRLAAPLVIGVVLTWCATRVATWSSSRGSSVQASHPEAWSGPVRSTALVCAAVFFAVLPGHVQQTSSLLELVPFAVLALYFSYVVHRTGTLLPVMVAHSMMNLLTFSFQLGALPNEVRGIGVLAALVGLAAGTELAGRRLGLATAELVVFPGRPERLPAGSRA